MHFQIVLKTDAGLSVNHVSPTFFTHSHGSSSFCSHPFLGRKRCMQSYTALKMQSYTALQNSDKNWPEPNVTEILDPQQSRTNRAAPPLFASLQFWVEKAKIRQRKVQIEQFNGVARDWWRHHHLASLLICSSPKDGSSLIPRAGFN